MGALGPAWKDTTRVPVPARGSLRRDVGLECCGGAALVTPSPHPTRARSAPGSGQEGGHGPSETPCCCQGSALPRGAASPPASSLFPRSW